MENYRFTLDTSTKKYHCPNCGKKTFVLYVDTEKQEYLPPHFGRCDRESNCAYHLNPYKEKYHHEENYKPPPRTKPKPIKAEPPKPTAYIEEKFYVKNLMKDKNYEINDFIIFLENRGFDIPTLEKVIIQYYLGTIGKGDYTGAVTFPFMDYDKNIRAVQIASYDSNNHRKKDKPLNYLHALLMKGYKQKNQTPPQWLQDYMKNDKKVSCLFGEHLLKKYPSNPVALVEAPKTAVYGALYYGLPKSKNDIKTYIWLAVGGLSYFTKEKLSILKNRFVKVFPDLSNDSKAFDQWKAKSREYGLYFEFSDLLERNATEEEKIKGLDLADYLIKFSPNEFL